MIDINRIRTFPNRETWKSLYKKQMQGHATNTIYTGLEWGDYLMINKSF